MKIGFVGTAGVGKSTLVEEMLNGDHCDYTRATNIQRILNKECNFGINQEATALSQSAISAHYAMEVLAYDDYITDRTIIDTFAYMAGGNLSNEEKENIYYMYKNVMHSYDFLFYIPIEFFPPEDGVRVTDEDYRSKIDNHMTNIMDNNNVKYYTITGTVEERIEKIYEIIGNFNEK